MSGYQAIVVDQDGATWDSIRDTEESALFKVSDYISRTDKVAADSIRNQLIFGTPTGLVEVPGYSICFQYIP